MGQLIVLDGLDGSGKETQTLLLQKALEQSGRRVKMISFPMYDTVGATFVKEYLGGRLPLFHFDMYRLGSSDDLWDIGWEDYLQRGGVCAVEWSENVLEAMADAAVVCIEKISDTCRRITLEGVESLADFSL